MKTQRRIRALFFLTVLLFVVELNHPAFAQGQSHSLVLTEQSSSVLNATYDGSAAAVTVTPVGPDSWSFIINLPVLFTGPTPNIRWIEPENPALWNLLQVNVNTGRVFSDSNLNLGPSLLPDGATFPVVFTDLRDGFPVSVTFFDRGDAAVPEGGSNLALLAIACGSLVLLSLL